MPAAELLEQPWLNARSAIAASPKPIRDATLTSIPEASASAGGASSPRPWLKHALHVFIIAERLNQCWNARYMRTASEPATLCHCAAVDTQAHVRVHTGDLAGSVFDSARLRRFSAVDNAQRHPSPIMREIFDAAIAEAEAEDAIAAGTLRGDEYQIQAAGKLDNDRSNITFTVRLVRLERGSASGEESYKVCTIACVGTRKWRWCPCWPGCPLLH